jgi:hypothetical protein
MTALLNFREGPFSFRLKTRRYVQFHSPLNHGPQMHKNEKSIPARLAVEYRDTVPDTQNRACYGIGIGGMMDLIFQNDNSTI